LYWNGDLNFGGTLFEKYFFYQEFYFTDEIIDLENNHSNPIPNLTDPEVIENFIYQIINVTNRPGNYLLHIVPRNPNEHYSIIVKAKIEPEPGS
jgi:hypothetical protein